MKEKKLKIISARLSLEDYKILKNQYNYNKNKHKTFSDYIRYLLELGFHDYY